ncbi:MAG TPA: HNH endonuclease [Kofleriaceae bacterium]
MSANDWPVDVDRVFGHWIWTGAIDERDGSGLIWRGPRPVRAYIIVFDKERGPIARGLVRDHLCRLRLCVAPHHLEPVTKDENERRKSWRYRVRIARCPAGHDLKLFAIVTPEGGRVCRECNRLALAS